jgi:hypothetical protein
LFYSQLFIYFLEGNALLYSLCLPTLVSTFNFISKNKQSELHWKFSIVAFEMSSVTNPVLISVQRPQISSLFLLSKRVSTSTSYGLLKSRTLQQHEAKYPSLAFSPLVKGLRLRERRFPVVAALAADAGDSEIGITNGLELHTSYFILL